MSGARGRQRGGRESQAEARRSAGNEENVQQSQPSTSSQQDSVESTQISRAAEQAYGQMGSDLQKRKVSEMVRYLLMSETRGTPVRKKELVDHVLGGDHSRSFPVVFEKANLQLSEVFGVRASEVLHGKTVCYVLVNCLPAEQVDSAAVWSDVDRCHMGLLFVLLSILMLKSVPVSEEHLWSILEKLGIRQESRHPVFGDVKAVISGYVEKMYLKKERQVMGDTAKFIYQWGPRAMSEVDKKALLKMVAELHDSDPGLWERQYQSVLQS